MALFFRQAEGKTQQASVSRTVSTPPWQSGKILYAGLAVVGTIRIKVAKVLHSSFPLHYFKTVIAGRQAVG